MLWTHRVTVLVCGRAGLEVPTGRHVTALVGSNVILECPLKFPNDEHVPYVIEWKKQVRRARG